MDKCSVPACPNSRRPVVTRVLFNSFDEPFHFCVENCAAVYWAQGYRQHDEPNPKRRVEARTGWT